MTVALSTEALPADEFLKELEDLRASYLGGRTLRPRTHYASLEEAAESKRRGHVGGSVHNHKFVGEKYLNCADKTLRRMNLRKMVDECGQTSVGVGLPSHPTLARWGSYEFGLTDEEIDRLEKEDMPAQSFMWQVTKVGLHRTAHWAVAIALSLVGEGEKLRPEIRQQLLDNLETLRRELTALGVKDVERALAFDMEHAGIDVEHAQIAVDVVRDFINTAELQEELRRDFKLTLQQRLA